MQFQNHFISIRKKFHLFDYLLNRIRFFIHIIGYGVGLVFYLFEKRLFAMLSVPVNTSIDRNLLDESDEIFLCSKKFVD